MDVVEPAGQDIAGPPATCDLRFSLQNRYASARLSGSLAALGVSSDAVTVSGRALRSEAEVDQAEFLAASGESIRGRFVQFLDEHRLPRDHSLLVLDLEPRGFAPRQLGDFEADRKLQHRLIDAYRRRIRAARQVVRQREVSGVRLGLYQVIVPDGRGASSEGFEQRMRGYRTAGDRGMYDQLDFICPVLYQRFGPDDAAAVTLRRWITASTRQGIEASLELTRRNGQPVPLVPIMSCWVFNGRSENNRYAVAPELLARQLDIVQRGVGIAGILFWSGWQTRREMETARDPVEPIDLAEFLTDVGALPWPGCS
jgi:hypothetical protein